MSIRDCKILKDSSNSFLCTVQNKNGDQYVKKWFRKHENNEELGRPTFKEVERDWKEIENRLCIRMLKRFIKMKHNVRFILTKLSHSCKVIQ